MATKDSLSRFAFLAMLAVAGRVEAQTIEIPVPFDSAGKIRVLTPPLVTRFSLAPPGWRVPTSFVEARLYASSTGDTVLVVARRDGAIERYTLAPTEIAALRNAVNEALMRTGPFVAEDASASVRPSFVRNQLILSLLLYGPGMAALANDAKTGTVLYLVGAGGTFFALSALARDMHVTRAQNHLSTDGALRGFALANGLLIAAAGDVPDRKTVAGVGLAGAVGGSILGFQRGRRLSDAEAHATSTGSSFTALTALGVLGAFGALESSNAERGVAAALAAAGVAGYFLGPQYPRRARYDVTAGDVTILWVGAALSTAAALTPFVGSNVDDRVAFAVATAGMLGGLTLMDATWVRSFDHSMSDVFQTWLGTIAGGLLGAAVVVLAEADEEAAVLGLVTAGAAIGAIAAHNMARPAPAAARRAWRTERGTFHRAGLELSPWDLALAAGKVPGLHPLLRVRF
jgi:hypothetical protein